MRSIKLKILPGDITLAKKLTSEFDKTKTYNKFVCKTNYIGILGEMLFDRYMRQKKKSYKWTSLSNNPNKENTILIKTQEAILDYKWVDFIKKGWTAPDYYINGKSIDLKTTYSDSMWFQKPKFDIYIYAHMTKDNKYLIIKGYSSLKTLKCSVVSGKAKQVQRGSRMDYVLSPKHMLPISTLEGIFPPLPQVYNPNKIVVNVVKPIVMGAYK